MKYRYINLINTSLILISLAIGTNTVAGENEDEEVQQSTKQTSSTQQIEPMTVVDTPVPLREDLDLSSITNIYRVEKSAQFGTEVFTREEIEKFNPADVNDLIEMAAGFNITYQGRRSPFFVSQRGGGSFTYIIDGAVLPPSVNRILYKIPVAAIEEMQIVRGSTSLTLGPSISIGSSSSGSGLNTGYIIIRTKQPKKTQAILSGSLEKYNGGHPIATNESLYLGTRIEKSSGNNGYIGILGSKMDKPSINKWFDGRSGEAGMVNTGLSAGKFNINLTAYKDSGSFEMQRSIGLDGTLSDMKWYYDSLKVQLLTTDMAMKWSPDQVTLLNLFKVEYDQHEWYKVFSTNTGSERGYEEETEGIGLRHNAQFGNTLIQVGGQMSNSKGLGGNLRSSYNKYDTTVTGWSVSAEHTLLDGKLSFDAGYREDTKHIDNSSTSTSNDSANNNVDMAPSKILALGAHWQINDTYTFDGRYYRGNQGTTGDFDMRLEDDATPHREKLDRIEAAVAADYTTWFKPVLTWFDIDTKNKKSASSITYELDSGTYYYYTESDELRRGLELMVKGNILKTTSYSLSWTRMLDIESTSDGVTTDSVGKSKPENLYGLTISHKLDKYRINLSIRRVDSWEDSTSETDILGGYTRIDANIKRDFNFRDFLLSVAIFGRNLKDENYITMGRSSGYYLDRGRSIGMKFTLEY